MGAGDRWPAHPTGRFAVCAAGNPSNMAKDDKFHKGDRVSWASHSGRAYGTVKEEITERVKVRGHPVDASLERPQYRIRNDDSGRDVAHRPEALRHEQE